MPCVSRRVRAEQEQMYLRSEIITALSMCREMQVHALLTRRGLGLLRCHVVAVLAGCTPLFCWYPGSWG